MLNKENIQLNQENTSEPAPPTSDDYTEPPMDENDIEYNELINIPDHEIVIIDKKYISNKHTKFFLKDRDEICERDSHGNLKIHENDITDIFDVDNVDQFYCKKTKERITLYDIENTPILNVIMKSSRKEMCIYKGEDSTEMYATININLSQNYNISFLNKTNNETEVLEMRYDKQKKYYCIYSKEGDKEVLIGTIKKLNTGRVRKRYTVEIAPMVDSMLLLGLGTIVVKIEKLKKEDNHNTDALLFAASFCVIS